MFTRIMFTIVLIYVCFYLNAYAVNTAKNIWTKELDIKKILKPPNPFGFIPFRKVFYIPDVSLYLKNVPTSFRPDTEVDGLIWEEDFFQYSLKIKVEKAEISDLRIDINFPNIVVHKEVYVQQGADNINFSQGSGIFMNGFISSDEQIHKSIENYSNNLKISSSKIFKDGYFEVKLVEKEVFTEKDGTFEISYDYKNESGENKKKYNIYKISRDKNNSLYIDFDKVIDKPSDEIILKTTVKSDDLERSNDISVVLEKTKK